MGLYVVSYDVLHPLISGDSSGDTLPPLMPCCQSRRLAGRSTFDVDAAYAIRPV